MGATMRAGEKSRMDSPNQEIWSGLTATTTKVVHFRALFTGSDGRNLGPNMGTSIALLIDSRSEGKRSVGSCGTIESGRLWMRSSTLVGASLKPWNELSPTGKLCLSFLVIASKQRGVSRRRGVGIGCESNSPMAVDRGSKGAG